MVIYIFITSFFKYHKIYLFTTFAGHRRCRRRRRRRPWSLHRSNGDGYAGGSSSSYFSSSSSSRTLRHCSIDRHPRRRRPCWPRRHLRLLYRCRHVSSSACGRNSYASTSCALTIGGRVSFLQHRGQICWSTGRRSNPNGRSPQGMTVSEPCVIYRPTFSPPIPFGRFVCRS